MAHTFTHVGLLQHGAVEAGSVFCSSDSPLTPDAWKRLKYKFGRKGAEWDVVITSPQVQCQAFAAWLANKHGLQLVEDEAWREIQFGAWEQRTPQQVLASHPDLLAQWWANPALCTIPDGEPFAVFRERVLGAWLELPVAYKGKRVLVVTHAHVIRVVMGLVLRMADERLLALNAEFTTLTELRILRDRSGEWVSLLRHGC